MTLYAIGLGSHGASLVEAENPQAAIEKLKLDPGSEVSVWRLGRFPTKYAVLKERIVRIDVAMKVER